jgi:hypothetical protein
MVSIYIYGYQNRPDRKLFPRAVETKCKKTAYPTKSNTCSINCSISLAGQFLMTYGKAPVSLGADGGFLPLWLCGVA